MGIIHKLTVGYVKQIFDTETGKCLGQEFVSSDEVNYENETDVDLEAPAEKLYHPFEMVQPVEGNSVDSDTIEKLAEAVCDAMDLDDLVSDFQEKQVIYLESLNDEEIQEMIDSYGIES